MTLKQVDFNPLKHWKIIRNLYRRSFPKEERIPFFGLWLLSLRKKVDFVLYFDKDLLAGFSYMIKNDRYAAILYLAVNSSVRGRGYGGQILSLIKESSDTKEVILNIEPLDDEAPNAEQRIKRLAFYEKKWFYTVSLSHPRNGC